MAHIKIFNRKNGGIQEIGKFIDMPSSDLSCKPVPKEWNAVHLVSQSYITKLNPRMIGIYFKAVGFNFGILDKIKYHKGWRKFFY